jgi:hypothetical protein
MFTKYQNILAWVLGIGVVSFAFRNYFYPGILIGLVLCIAVLFIMFVLILNDKNRPKNVLGSKLVWIPLLIISLSIIVSGISVYLNNKNASDLFIRIVIAVVFFGVYLACRIFGEKVFRPFAIAVVIETSSVVVNSLILHYGIHNGGLASFTDYNVAIALLLFGAIVSIFYKQWIIVAIASVGIFFTGAEEGIFALAIISLVILIRRDFSKRILLLVGLVVIIVILGITPFSYTRDLYAQPIDKISELITHKHNKQSVEVSVAAPKYIGVSSPNSYNNKLDYILNGRLNMMEKALDNLKPLGSGYVMNPVDPIDNAIYNVPLVIVQQVGVLAGIAWVFVTILCLVKAKWKYVFIALIALSCFDNFIFCQLGAWWFCLVGISTTSMRKSDLIFKEIN